MNSAAATPRDSFTAAVLPGDGGQSFVHVDVSQDQDSLGFLTLDVYRALEHGPDGATGAPVGRLVVQIDVTEEALRAARVAEIVLYVNDGLVSSLTPTDVA